MRALSDSGGDSCQSYEYSIYGQVAAEDPNHPNPYMFTGRRFDIETGLYYYRARYYNPHIGRFMQTDPVGYSAGINWYLYCGNNPLGWVDFTGREPVRTKDYPGWVYDVWIRPPGHAAPGDWPGLNVYPYYTQHFPMSCAPVAILNWWLTYDEPPLGSPENDLEAEQLVMAQLGPKIVWTTEGLSTFSRLRRVMNRDDGSPATLVKSKPTAGKIVDLVTGEIPRAVLVGYDTDCGPGRSWHAILIAPTPASMQDDVPGQTISVIDGIYPAPLTFTPDEFKAWWTDITKSTRNFLGGAWSEYVFGGEVPQHTEEPDSW